MNTFSLCCQIGQTKNTFTNLMTLIILMCFRILIIGAKDPDSGVERIEFKFKAPSTGLVINQLYFVYPNPARVRAFLNAQLHIFAFVTKASEIIPSRLKVCHLRMPNTYFIAHVITIFFNSILSFIQSAQNDFYYIFRIFFMYYIIINIH